VQGSEYCTANHCSASSCLAC